MNDRLAAVDIFETDLDQFLESCENCGCSESGCFYVGCLASHWTAEDTKEYRKKRKRMIKDLSERPIL